MESERLCAYLEDILRILGITVRYDDLKSPDHASKGGICRIKGQEFVFIDKDAKATEKIRLLTQSLKGMDLEGIYIKPAIRAVLDLDAPVKNGQKTDAQGREKRPGSIS